MAWSPEADWEGRTGGNAAIELFRSDDCTGVAIATYTMGFSDVGPIDGALFANELDTIARRISLLRQHTNGRNQNHSIPWYVRICRIHRG